MQATTLKTLITLYNINNKQIEQLKQEVYLASMYGNADKVAKLRELIISYENDMFAFEQQVINYKTVGEK